MGSDQIEGAPYPVEQSASLMDCLMTHYLKQHKVVKKKLQHAQTATHDTIDEIRQNKSKSAGAKEKMTTRMQQIDQMWRDIIKLFEIAGLSAEDITKIEKVLLMIPKEIKKRYETLVEKDKELVALIEEIENEAYQKALAQAQALTEKAQGKRNIMSDLTDKDYETEDISVEAAIDNKPDDVDAYVVLPNGKRANVLY